MMLSTTSPKKQIPSSDLMVLAVERRFKAKGDDIELAVLKYLDASDDDNETKAAHIRGIVEEQFS